MKTFRRELISLINKHSRENGSNTPDFILAEYLLECLHTFDKITKMRNEWYGEKLLESKILESRNEFEKEIDRHLEDDIDHNNLCARATLYPGKSIEEVHDIQYMNRVGESYKFINSVLNGTTPMNTEETRKWVTQTLEGRLRKYGVVVQCNESNNPPELIDQNLCVAKIMRTNSQISKDNKFTIQGYKYMDLLFGEEQQVQKYHAEHYFDSAIYTYIGKGI